MPGPYGVVWRGEDERGKGGRQPAPLCSGRRLPVDGWPRQGRGPAYMLGPTELPFTG